jgi:LytR cell envelope-related transcriptional attenuator/LytR_cpsA_psr family
VSDDAPSGDGGRAARRRAAQEAAREQAHTSRRRALLVSGAVLALLALLAVGVWAFLGRSQTDPSSGQPTASPTATKPAQPTMLIQIKTTDGIAVDNALTSVGGSVGAANIITMPPTLVLDVATGGTLPLGQIARLPDPNGSANAISDAIGVNVDSTFVMDTLALSGLVDAVGGVAVDVDVDVTVTQADGSKLVLVPAGKNETLQGPQAAAYATFLAPGEPEAARTARFIQVLRQTILKLPVDTAKVESMVAALGASAKSTVPALDVAKYLVAMRTAILTDNVVYEELPTKVLDTASTVQAFTVDNAKTAAMVQKLLPDALRQPGPNSKVRVLVENGVGTPGLNAAARQLLVDAGFTYINGGNAPKFGMPRTEIVVPDATTASLKWGSDIATALKVPQSAVKTSVGTQSIADVIVVLGEDFKPTSS